MCRELNSGLVHARHLLYYALYLLGPLLIFVEKLIFVEPCEGQVEGLCVPHTNISAPGKQLPGWFP